MAKHHYLPQFYLKGFTDQTGQFMIWSVKQGRFKSGGKPFSPASHFFLPDDNKITADGVDDNYLEELYSAEESRHARILEKIKAVDQGFGLNQLNRAQRRQQLKSSINKLNRPAFIAQMKKTFLMLPDK